MRLLYCVCPFVISLYPFQTLNIISYICHKSIIFRLLRVQLWDIVTQKFRYHKVHVSQIVQTCLSFLYEIVQIVEFRFHFIPYRSQFTLVFLIVKQNICLLDCVKNYTVNAGDKGLVLNIFTKQFWLLGNFDQVAADCIHLSEFEISMSQPGQVGEVESQLRLVLSKPFFDIAVLNLIEVEFEIRKEMPDKLTSASEGPITKSDFLVMGQLLFGHRGQD